MSTKRAVPLNSPKLVRTEMSTSKASQLLEQYGCGPIPFVGTENAFYERHLVFDRVIDPKVASARERFEAFSSSIRDILAQRWVLTKTTYERENAKRIYYLSMEFLLGEVINAFGILSFIRCFGQDPALREDVAYRTGKRLKAFTRTRHLRVDHTIKNQMPFVKRVFRPDKRNRPASVLFEKL